MEGEWRLSHWLLSNVRNNVGRAWIRTNIPWVDSPRRYRLRYLPTLGFSPMQNSITKVRWIDRWMDGWIVSIGYAWISMEGHNVILCQFISCCCRVIIYDAFAADNFWKHCGKWRKAHHEHRLHLSQCINLYSINIHPLIETFSYLTGTSFSK